MMTFRQYCTQQYMYVYESFFQNGAHVDLGEARREELERQAQKEAMKTTIIAPMDAYPDEEPAELWKAIHAAHIARKSGISDLDVTDSVVSAEQSWKKSSGHAFEEMLVALGKRALECRSLRPWGDVSCVSAWEA